MIAKRELYTSHFYERAINAAPDDAWIAVEQINGPVLFLTADRDTVCPSGKFARIADERLKKSEFPYPHQHISYRYASHFLLPVEYPKAIPLGVMATERKYPKECAESRLDSLRRTVQWLRDW
jgi:dienelactone hydrolase